MGNKSRHYPLIWIQAETVVGRLAIRELHRREYANPIDTIHVGVGATVGELSVEDLTLENHTGLPCAKLRCLGSIERLRSSCISEDEIEREEQTDLRGN